MRAVPGSGLRVPLYILGSSLFGAQVAAALGLPFAFASHFAPAAMMQAIQIYRSHFRPSESLAEPYLLLGINVVAAATDAEARLLATSGASILRQSPPRNADHTPAAQPGLREGRGALRPHTAGRGHLDCDGWLGGRRS